MQIFNGYFGLFMKMKENYLKGNENSQNFEIATE